MSEVQSKILILKNCRLSYPHLWTPQDPMAGSTSKPKYGATLLLPSDDPQIKVIKDEMQRVAKDKFGENWAAIVGAMEASKKCLRNGDKALDKGGNVQAGYAGMMYLVAKNTVRPMVVNKVPKNADGTWNLVPEDSGIVYGGCYVNAKVEIYAMKAKGTISNNISATLVSLQFFRKGDAFGAGPATAEGFENVEGDEDESAFEGATAGAGAGNDDPFAD
jgi:hypothetical protein